MLTVTQSYIENIRKLGKQISIRLKYDDVIIENTGIKSISKEFDADFFRTTMQQVSFEIKGLIDLSNKWINVELGVSYDGSSYEYVDWGEFKCLASQVERNEETQTTKVSVAYDKMINTHQIFDNTQINIVYPLTVGELFEKVCTFCDLEYVSSTFPNSDQIITEDKYTNIEDVTYRNILDEIARVSGTGIFISGGKVKVANPTSTNQTLRAGIRTMKFGDVFGAVNIINVAREPQHDNYILPADWETIPVDQRVELVFPNVQLMDKDRETFAPDLYNNVLGLTYTPFEINTSGYGYFEPFDIVDVQDNEGVTHNTVILNSDIAITTGITEVLKSNIPSYAKEQYALITDNRKEFLRVYFIVDQQNGIIQGVVERQDEQEETISQMTIKIGQIELIVSELGYPNKWFNSSGISDLVGYTFQSSPLDMREDIVYDMAEETDYDMREENQSIMDVIEIDNIAGTGFQFIYTGKAYSKPVSLLGGDTYYLRTYSMGNSNKFDIWCIEYLEDGTENKRTMILQLPNYSAYNMNEANITLDENTVAVNFMIDTELEETDRYILTRTMFTQNAAQEYSVTAEEVFFYSQTRLDQTEEKLGLYAFQTSLDETNQTVNYHSSSIELLRNQIVLKAEKTIVDGINESIHSTVLDIDAITGINVYGSGMTWYDSDRNKKVYFDLEENRYIYEGKTISIGEDATMEIDNGRINMYSSADTYLGFFGRFLASINGGPLQEYLGYREDNGTGISMSSKFRNISLDGLGFSVAADGIETSESSWITESYLTLNNDKIQVISKDKEFTMDDDHLLIYNTNTYRIYSDSSVFEIYAGGGTWSFSNDSLTSSGRDLGGSSDRFNKVYCISVDQSSSRDLKENIKDIEVDFIDDLNPKQYTRNDAKEDSIHMGFISQEVYELLGKNGYHISTEESLRYTEFIAPIVKYIQELKKRTIAAEKKTELLENRIEKLEKQIASFFKGA